MDSPHDLPKGCAICETFVSGLEVVYDEQAWIDHDIEIRWSFKDQTPHLPNLTESASRGCPWCSLLDRTIPTPRTKPSGDDSESQETSIELCFSGSKKYGDCRLRTENPFRGEYAMEGLDLELFVLNSDDFVPLSNNNVERIRRALDTCVQDHQTCPGFEKATSPLRLLNVMDGDSVKLEQMQGREERYAALSYCWGQSEHEHRTTEANIETRLEEKMSLQSLPDTLRDAVKVARELKIQYLWIDALCIVQDSDQDWPCEAQKMMHYYGNAYVTIVPVLSDSVHDGMRLGSHKPVYHGIPRPRSLESTADLILSTEGSSYTNINIFLSPWDSRGWTYQERLNSSRVLFIFGHYVTLECREGAWDSLRDWQPRRVNDVMNFLPAPSIVHTHDAVGNSYDFWADLVHFFTRRRLTKPVDQSYSFSGIMETYSKAFNRQIIAGLWRDRIIQELVNWTPQKRQDTRQPNFPSWTWLGTDWSSRKEGVMLHLTSTDALQEPSAHLESIVNEDKLESVSLVISGAILENDRLLNLVAFYRGSLLRQASPGRGRNIAHFDDAYDSAYTCSCAIKHMSRDCESYNIISSISPPVSAVLIGLASFAGQPQKETNINWHFLLIQPTIDRPKSHLPEFRRVGTLHIPEDQLNSSHPEIMTGLKSQEKSSIILV